KILGPKDKNGNTAFHLAYKHRNHSLARLLALYMPLNLKKDILFKYCSNYNISELKRIQIHSIMYENTAANIRYFAKELVFPAGTLSYLEQSYWDLIHNKSNLRFNDIAEKIDIQKIFSNDKPDEIQQEIFELFVHLFWDPKPSAKSFWVDPLKAQDLQFYFTDNSFSACYAPYKYTVIVPQLFDKSVEQTHTYHLSQIPKIYQANQGKFDIYKKAIKIYYTTPNGERMDYAKYIDDFVRLVVTGSDFTFYGRRTSHIHKFLKLGGWSHINNTDPTCPLWSFNYIKKNHFLTRCVEYVVKNKVDLLVDYIKKNDIDIYSQLKKLAGLQLKESKKIKRYYALQEVQADDYQKIKKITDICLNKYYVEPSKLNPILHKAAQAGNSYFMRDLIKKGACIFSLNKDKKNAIEVYLDYMSIVYEFCPEELGDKSKVEYGKSAFFERKKLKQFLSICNELSIGINLSDAPTKVNTLEMDTTKKSISTEFMEWIIDESWNLIDVNTGSQLTLFYYNLMFQFILNRTWKQDKYLKKDMGIETEEMSIKKEERSAWKTSFEKDLDSALLDNQFSFFKTKRLKRSMQCEDLTFRRCAMAEFTCVSSDLISHIT
ncbi:MAG: hypothetical protein K2X39_01830, partial [Silvanigrellaceae bacterium]|nr:hypothetical protein [Silvanigrellaceae bacterium]